MRYLSFEINNYRAIGKLSLQLDTKLIPLIGINECGKTTILQAIYAFDYTNDDEYESRHLNSTQNLYDTVDVESSIAARISLKVSDVIDIFDEINRQIDSGELVIPPEELPFEYEPNDIQRQFGGPQKDVEIEIQRNLGDKSYSTDWNSDNILYSRTANQQFCKKLVVRLPYILYNDDFADRAPTEVVIPLTKPKALTGWLAIYERLFRQTNPNYSLFSLIEESDSRRRDSILSDVEAHLNDTLSEAWKNFSTEKKTVVNVALSVTDGTDKKLRIQIIEQLGNRNRYFDVLEPVFITTYIERVGRRLEPVLNV